MWLCGMRGSTCQSHREWSSGGVSNLKGIEEVRVAAQTDMLDLQLLRGVFPGVHNIKACDLHSPKIFIPLGHRHQRGRSDCIHNSCRISLEWAGGISISSGEYALTQALHALGLGGPEADFLRAEVKAHLVNCKTSPATTATCSTPTLQDHAARKVCQ